jgi:hypothetical protein
MRSRKCRPQVLERRKYVLFDLPLILSLGHREEGWGEERELASQGRNSEKDEALWPQAILKEKLR